MVPQSKSQVGNWGARVRLGEHNKYPLWMLQGSQQGSHVSDLEQGLCNGAGESSSIGDGLRHHCSGSESSSGQHGKLDVEPDRTILGLALYGISSLFLATVLMCAKLLGEPFNCLLLGQICHHTSIQAGS